MVDIKIFSGGAGIFQVKGSNEPLERLTPPFKI